MYRTGDLVRRLPTDGALVYLGRADEQVKSAATGSSWARSRPACRAARRHRRPPRSCTAPAWSATSPRPQWTPTPSRPSWPGAAAAAPDVASCWRSCRCTPSGKLDRAALPAPARRARRPAGRATTAQRSCATSSPTSSAWTAVGADDDFFTLGGDSILSITRVRAAPAGAASTSAPRTSSSTAPRPRSPRSPRHRRAPAPRRGADRGRRRRRRRAAAGRAPAARARRPDRPVHAVRCCVRTPAGATAERLTGALQAVLDRHDGLRLKLTEVAPVLWSLDAQPVGRGAEVRRVDVRDGPTTCARVVAAESAAATGRLAPTPARCCRPCGSTPARGRAGCCSSRTISWSTGCPGGSCSPTWPPRGTGERARPGAHVAAPLRPHRHRAGAGPAPARRADALAETLAPGADLVPAPGRARSATLAAHVGRAVHSGHRAAAAGRATSPTCCSPPCASRSRAGAARRDLLVDVERHGREGEPRPVPHGRLAHQRAARPAAGRRGHDRARSRELLARRARPRHRLRHAAPPQRAVRAAARRLAAAQVLFNYFGRFPAAPARGLAARRPSPTRSTCCPTRTWAVRTCWRSTRCARRRPTGPRLRATWTWAGALDRRPTWRALADELAGRRCGELAGATSTRLLDQAPRTSRRPAGRGRLAAVPAAGGPVLPRRLRPGGPTSTPRRARWTSRTASTPTGCARRARRCCAQPQPARRASPATGCRAPVQFVAAAPELPIAVVDLADEPGRARPRAGADGRRPRAAVRPRRPAAVPDAAAPARRRHRPAGHQPPPDPVGRLVPGPRSSTSCSPSTSGRRRPRPARARRLPRLPDLAGHTGHRAPREARGGARSPGSTSRRWSAAAELGDAAGRSRAGTLAEVRPPGR